MSTPIGIGVLGLGSRGIYLGWVAQNTPGAQVVAVCDRNAKRFEIAHKRIGAPDIATYTDAAAMLADPRVQAVIVATHDKAHAETGGEVLRAGRHLFLEKPMAQTITDCDALIEAWQAAQTVFMIGLELRYCSVCEDIKRIIERGDIGDVRLGYAVDNVSVGGQYFFHDALRSRDFVGNLLLQKGTHTIDLMNWWFGAQPVRVYAEGGLDAFGGSEPADKRCRDCDRAGTCPYYMSRDFTWDYGESTVRRDDFCVWSEQVDIEDNTIVTTRYDNGTKMVYIECHFTPDYNRHFTLIGTKGRIYGYYDNEQKFRIEVTYRHSEHKDVIHSERREGGHGGGDPRIMQAFVQHIAAGRPTCPGVMGARNSAAIAAAASEAIDAGMPIAIPPCPLIEQPTTV
ncbi:MAG: Gfo/Idh/MocA family protein [Phycisphaeraceae bacterium]